MCVYIYLTYRTAEKQATKPSFTNETSDKCVNDVENN